MTNKVSSYANVITLNETAKLYIMIDTDADTVLESRTVTVASFRLWMHTSQVADGATAVGFTWNTPAYTTAGALLAALQNNEVNKFTVDKDGDIWSSSGVINVGGNSIQAIAFTEASSHVIIDVEMHAGITAGTTQTQAGGFQLLSSYNQVSTVATTGDSVVAPAAVKGRILEVINDGANALWLWPAVSDNMGTGVDTKYVIEANETVTFRAYDATNWDVEGTTERVHGSMYDEDNTDAFVISDAGGDLTGYHTNGMTAADELGWTFDAGGAGTSFPIASIADAGGGDITVTTTGSHLLAVGDVITQTNLADAAYVGVFVVQTVPSGTTYTVTATYTATGTGTMDQPAYLECDTGSDGVHEISWSASATSATSNETFDYKLYKGASAVLGSSVRRKFGTAGDFGSFGAHAPPVAVVAGDKIVLVMSNTGSAGNITIRNFVMLVDRV